MKSISTKVFLMFLSGFFYHGVSAQKILSDTITWNSTRAVEQKKSDAISYSCRFVTFSNQSIDWIQNGVTRVYHFKITDVSGSWDDVTHDGTLVYSVSLGDFTGALTFTKVSDQKSAHLKIARNGAAEMDYVFDIASVRKGVNP